MSVPKENAGPTNAAVEATDPNAIDRAAVLKSFQTAQQRADYQRRLRGPSDPLPPVLGFGPNPETRR